MQAAKPSRTQTSRAVTENEDTAMLDLNITVNISPLESEHESEHDPALVNDIRHKMKWQHDEMREMREKLRVLQQAMGLEPTKDAMHATKDALDVSLHS